MYFIFHSKAEYVFCFKKTLAYKMSSCTTFTFATIFIINLNFVYFEKHVKWYHNWFFFTAEMCTFLNVNSFLSHSNLIKEKLAYAKNRIFFKLNMHSVYILMESNWYIRCKVWCIILRCKQWHLVLIF